MSNQKHDYKVQNKEPNQQEIFQWITEAIGRTPEKYKILASDIASKNGEDVLAINFNNYGADFLSTMEKLSYKYNSGIQTATYIRIFNEAKKANILLPIDNGSKTILIFVDKIFNVDVDFFLSMENKQIDVPDNASNTNFSFLRSEQFRTMWLKLTSEEQSMLKQKLIVMTTYALAYFKKKGGF